MKEANDVVIDQLFVEVFGSREKFHDTLFSNLKRVEEVETEMTGGVKRKLSDCEDLVDDGVGDVNEKVRNMLDVFEEKDVLYTSKFFKLLTDNGIRTLAISYPRIKKKAGTISYNLSFKGLDLKTDTAMLTNLDSNVMTGRGNIGPAFCTLVPLDSLSRELKSRVYEKFNVDEDEATMQSQVSVSQEVEFTQSQTAETLIVCKVCRFATRDKVEMKNHMDSHYKCNICGKHFYSAEDLEKHVPDHSKRRCKQCGLFIRDDEMIKHRKIHEKVSEFNKKASKALKPVTAYGLWQ